MLNAIYDAAKDLQRFCEFRQWQFCFIGGLAVQRWGEPRQTQDADLTLLTGFGVEQGFVDSLLEAFSGRRGDARDFALRYRVLLLKHRNGVPLDIALGALPFEEQSIQRSSLWNAASDCALRTCSAEDLVIHKAFANRNIDWFDIERIVQRQEGNLNLALIRRELVPLVELKEQPEILSRLDQLLKEKTG